ncbi:MAG: hypothetical protein M3494_11615 [Actinomycetota bacterium]|nr:hypothetical protein [Actinomycetota bacterium]
MLFFGRIEENYSLPASQKPELPDRIRHEAVMSRERISSRIETSHRHTHVRERGSGRAAFAVGDGFVRADVWRWVGWGMLVVFATMNYE